MAIIMKEMEQMLYRVRKDSPVVHLMTDYVTVNDCANMCLACNVSPVIADEESEVEEIVQISSSLLLNIGTLNQRTVKSMLAAGRKANILGKPVIFDPAGAGITAYRSEVVKLFVRELDIAVIKGNISEVKSIFGGCNDKKGVVTVEADLVTEETLEEAVRFARELSIMSGALIVITGPIDIISDSRETYICRNGHPFMTKVTGTGCMLGGMIAGFVGANPDNPLLAAASAVCIMGICGELAYKRMCELDSGTGIFRSLMVDFMSKMKEETLSEYQRIEKR